MESHLLRLKASDIHWFRFGTGESIVFCFHGYGEQASGYQFLTKFCSNNFSFISIDLPYHGKTQWEGESPFVLNDLIDIVNAICLAIGRPSSRFSLMGFSLGGRIALSVFEKLPERIDRMVLLAPDGLKVNFWYWFSTQTIIGNKLFAFTMKNPQWFFGLLKVINRLGLINTSIFKFVKYYVHDKPVRELLYARWMVLRKFTPDIKSIKKQIATSNTPVRILYGQHDRIILSSVGERFRKGIERQCKISIIEAGHQVLHEKHAADIMAALTE